MRAQAHTLEGIVAAMLILTSVIIALQVTAVTPLTASTASQHIETQEQASTAGMLSAARSDGLIRPTVLFWNETIAGYHNAGDSGYYATGPPTEFGSLLNETFNEAGYAFNVVARYTTSTGNLRERKIVYMGNPSDSASAASVTITLYDDDRLLDSSGAKTRKGLRSTPFFVDDVSPDSQVYAVIDVEVIVWRM